MIDNYFEAEYNNRTKVPGHPAVIAGWVRDAAAFRDSARNAEFDVAYGPSARQAMDIFWPGTARGGRLAMFIHGGYWQGLDKSFMSHMAGGLLAHGVAVAVPGYDLCPLVTLDTIVEQIRAAARFLLARHGRLDVATGHSAGGHLAARMGCADIGLDRVVRVVPISPLAELEPLRATSMRLGLDAAEVAAESPARLGLRAGCAAHVWVGGQERPAFLWQARLLSEAWDCAWTVEAGRQHFDVIDGLEDAASGVMSACLA